MEFWQGILIFKVYFHAVDYLCNPAQVSNFMCSTLAFQNSSEGKAKKGYLSFEIQTKYSG